ncbi:ubiquitin elongating factor core-domain-containing protein [Jimgerdemannia flammicorona]|uniref:RING-type E3 ubiquitin transferase n=1 Tax=Jimgerdemannia flammicorona TaxID=994334 RepID=A0A433QPA7_9FUNG|nr:ubiquitin elongating factor core-domain-containing protein [Jimgerdemannia flammicorona]
MDDPTPFSDAEKIRLKRLAKLRQQEESQPPSSSAPSASSSASASRPAQPLAPKPVLQEAVPASTGSRVTKVESKPTTPAVTPAPTPTPKPAAPAKSFEDWQNEALSRILQVTLNPDAVSKGGVRHIYLITLAVELECETSADTPRPFRITADIFDKTLIARLSIDPNNPGDEYAEFAAELRVPLFEYMLSCWRRVQEIRKGMWSRQRVPNEPGRISAADRCAGQDQGIARLVRRVGVADAGHVSASAADVPLGSEQLVPRLLVDTDTAEGLPDEFFKEMVARFKDEDDALAQIFGPALTGLSGRIRGETILGDYWPPALTMLTEHKNFASVLPSLPNWDPAFSTPRTIELMSLLGPFFRLSVFPDDQPSVAENYFANSEGRNKADIDSAITSLRGTVRTIQNNLFGILNNIVRASPTGKDGVLSYLASVARKNEKRAQMQVDRQTVATDGFMGNLAAVLLNFCNPFMDASKIDRIDPDYLRTPQSRIDVSKDTKINATQEESDAYYKEGAAQPDRNPHFITESFFLALTFLHYGPIRSLVNYNDFLRSYNDCKNQYQRMKDEQPRWANLPQVAMNETILKRMKDQVEKLLCHKLALDAALQDPEFLSHMMRFYNLVMTWLVRLVDPKGGHPSQAVGLPLPNEIPKLFAMLPEWIIEDIVEFFIFVGKFGYESRVMRMNSKDELVTFAVTFLRSSKYIKNPYLKAKLVEIFFYFTYPLGKGIPGELDVTLNSHALALDHLVPAIMAFYVEVEQTGASSQFYDKFNIRYNISQSRNCRNPESFTRFVNMLMSDVTYLLDESLTKLAEIHRIQSEMGDTAAWEAQTQQHRQERESYLRTLERQAQSYVALGNETVHMLQYLTAEVVEPFMSPEIVERLAAMLDYNLAQLVGPKCMELKVKNPEKYHFRPRDLLGELIDIYLHLNCPDFVIAVARDERSYKKEWFRKASGILLKYGLKDNDAIATLEKFVSDVEVAVQSGIEEEEALGDVPDDFLDPIFFTLMKDPVKLPTSGTTVDRSTIRTHLLGDTRDPFNRAPLSMEMVVPDDEMKERIRIWKDEQRRTRRQQRLAALQDEGGDPSGIEEEEALGDVPDDFLDPIFFTLMKDPVKLPTSGTTVDRSTIRSHLLGDTCDPFNRAPLSIEMVVPGTNISTIPDDEMKERIRIWKDEQRRTRRQQRLAALQGEGGDPMDTSA